jgi:citrate synthase
MKEVPTMNLQIQKSPIGLDGVPAAETALSHVDGARGELIIAGERVGELARAASFEGVTARLWTAGTGQPIGEAEVRAELGAARSCWRPPPACRSSTACAPRSPRCAPNPGSATRPPSSVPCR